MPHPTFHTLRIAERRQETAESVTLAFEVPPELKHAYRFRPGQYVTLRATINGADVRRPYSICSELDDWALRVAVERVDGGLFSTWACSELHTGDTLSVMTPDGRFGLPPASESRVILAFAAGAGIAPIRSILKTLVNEEPDSRFILFHGNRTAAHIMFREEFAELADYFIGRVSLFNILSEEVQGIGALDGHLDAARVRRLVDLMVPIETVDVALLVGPQPEITGLGDVLLGLGVPPERLRVEYFTPAAEVSPRFARVPPEAPPVAVVTAVSDGASGNFSLAAGETIIDAAIRAGLALPYSCQGGICTTCRARVLEGQVDMAPNNTLAATETAAGFVLTCQARPLTSRVVVDFDQM